MRFDKISERGEERFARIASILRVYRASGGTRAVWPTVCVYHEYEFSYRRLFLVSRLSSQVFRLWHLDKHDFEKLQCIIRQSVRVAFSGGKPAAEDSQQSFRRHRISSFRVQVYAQVSKRQTIFKSRTAGLSPRGMYWHRVLCIREGGCSDICTIHMYVAGVVLRFRQLEWVC